MPEMDGLEVARTVCKPYPRRERPRIVALTADAGDGDRELCFAAGMDDYISKSVLGAMIAQALRHALLARSANRPLYLVLGQSSWKISKWLLVPRVAVSFFAGAGK
jgi:DNA-binding NarL/FixJ family response regulator